LPHGAAKATEAAAPEATEAATRRIAGTLTPGRTRADSPSCVGRPPILQRGWLCRT
jgi:hypothetical protein